MTQALLGSRKRVRSNNCDEECCDFMPLSKRINNLHINNANCCSGLAYEHKFSVAKQNEFYEDWSNVNSVGEYLELSGNIPSFPQNERIHCQPSLQSANNNFTQRSEQSIEATGSNSGIHPNSWMTDNILSQYSPTLSASENPYYYENNKLLFALYMERLHRNGETLY